MFSKKTWEKAGLHHGGPNGLQASTQSKAIMCSKVLLHHSAVTSDSFISETSMLSWSDPADIWASRLAWYFPADEGQAICHGRVRIWVEIEICSVMYYFIFDSHRPTYFRIKSYSNRKEYLRVNCTSGIHRAVAGSLALQGYLLDEAGCSDVAIKHCTLAGWDEAQSQLVDQWLQTIPSKQTGVWASSLISTSLSDCWIGFDNRLSGGHLITLLLNLLCRFATHWLHPFNQFQQVAIQIDHKKSNWDNSAETYHS